MRKLKRGTGIVLTIALLAALLGGCSQNAGSPADGSPAATASAQAPASPSASAQPTSSTRTVQDLAGNDVTIPSELHKVAITSWMGALGAFALLGRIDMVSSMADTSRYAWLRHAYPQLTSLPDYGNFDKVNVEELVKSNPDIIISPNSAAETNKKMQSLNLPVYVDGITVKDSDDVMATWHSELMGIANLIGETEKAQKYLDYTNDILSMVQERVSTIPESERKTALVVRSSILEVFADNIDCGLCVKYAGGINVAATAGDRYFTTSAENVTKWNPDFIFQTIVTAPYDSKMAAYYDDWKADKRYQDITAVKNGDAYIMPMGVTQWNGDVELALGVLQMAKIMYPDLFKDIDVKAEATKFYQTFMNYTLTDEDFKIMAPNFNNAKSNGLS
ncbi:substrate-binding protein [Sporobacter termitidis DSM 10068]|uniref:Substrate-binding protein n=1 Tax=Sporobacter termitidis DSM 10068 TaxID=1123282 RepID=A0A1M5XCE4_9FIRM|nr:ABC transporter substrate-binding protein [Sporobacter termitidis]SHH97446.1 substrate-binding protein [Sporobacter termitidis DSM 10068]